MPCWAARASRPSGSASPPTANKSSGWKGSSRLRERRRSRHRAVDDARSERGQGDDYGRGFDGGGEVRGVDRDGLDRTCPAPPAVGLDTGAEEVRELIRGEGEIEFGRAGGRAASGRSGSARGARGCGNRGFTGVATGPAGRVTSAGAVGSPGGVLITGSRCRASESGCCRSNTSIHSGP